MNIIKNLIERLTTPPPEAEDFKRYEKAKKRLIKSAEKFESDCDHFGNLVNDMRGDKKCSTRKRSQGKAK